jgi:SET domain-containing protein 6
MSTNPSQESQLDEDELEEFFIVERDSGAPDEEGRLTEEAVLREVSPELEEQLKALLKALKKSKPELADKRKRDETFNSVVAKALADKMAEYPTTREEDEALLRKSDLASRHRMAVEVRLGEKILLQEAIELVKAAAAPKVEEATERPAKRTKTKA